MAVKPPQFQNKIAYSSIEDAHCGLYSKRLKFIGEGSLGTKYYWITTDEEGTILPKKNIAIIEYDTIDACLANLPFGYVLDTDFGTRPSAPTPTSLSGVVGVVFTGTASQAGTIQIFRQPDDHMVANIQTSPNSPYTWSYTPDEAGSFNATLGVSGMDISLRSSTWTISNPSGGGGNSTFETTTLKNILKGTNYAPTNYFNLGDFPATPPTVSNYAINLMHGNASAYRNAGGRTMIEKGLADAEGNNELWTYAEVPDTNRMAWYAYHPTLQEVQTRARDLGRDEVNKYYGADGARIFDRNGVVGKNRFLFADCEGFEWSSSPTGYGQFALGGLDAGIAHRPDFTLIMYGVQLNHQIATFNPQGNSNYVFPKIDPTLLPKHHLPNGTVTTAHKGKNIIFDCTTYWKVPVPQITAIYQKSGGNFVLDGNGNRTYRTSGFSETFNNYTYQFNVADPSSVPDAVTGEHYKSVVPDWHLGLYFPYIHFARIFNATRMVMNLDGSNNYQDYLQSGYRLGCVQRLTLEANTWTNATRHPDPYSATLISMLSLVLTNNMVWWDGHTRPTGLSYDMSSDEGGQLYIQPEPFADQLAWRNWDNNAVRQSYAINYLLRQYNRDYGLFTNADKVLYFTDYINLDLTKEALAFGRYNQTTGKIFIGISYPLLEFDESCTFTLGNTQNNITHTITITGRSTNGISEGVYSFAGTSNLQPNQIWIQYTTIKGVTIKVSGDWNYHTVGSNQTGGGGGGATGLTTLYSNSGNYVKYLPVTNVFEKISTYNRDDARRMMPFDVHSWCISNFNASKVIHSFVQIMTADGTVIYEHNDDVGASAGDATSGRNNNHQSDYSKFLIKEGTYTISMTNKSTSTGVADLIIWENHEFYSKILVGNGQSEGNTYTGDLTGKGEKVYPGSTVTKTFTIQYLNENNYFVKSNANGFEQ